jgi:hypothetical protein
MIEHDDEGVSRTDGSRERSSRALSARELVEHYSKRRREPLHIPEAQAPPEPAIEPARKR